MAAGMTAADWERIQRKTFVNWANFWLKQRDLKINNVEEDLKDGLLLINLFEILTGQAIDTYNKNPKTKLHRVENIHIALHNLKCIGVRHDVSPNEIEKGNTKSILGMFWAMITRLQIHRGAGGAQENSKASGKELILEWCRNYLKDYPVGDLKSNSPKCFQDGKVLAYLAHKTDPNSVDLAALEKEDPLVRAQKAMDAAEKFGVPKLIDAEDLVKHPDEQSILTYLAAYKNVVDAMKPKVDEEEAKRLLEQKLKEEEAQRLQMMQEEEEERKKIEKLKKDKEELERKKKELEEERLRKEREEAERLRKLQEEEERRQARLKEQEAEELKRLEKLKLEEADLKARQAREKQKLQEEKLKLTRALEEEEVEKKDVEKLKSVPTQATSFKVHDVSPYKKSTPCEICKKPLENGKTVVAVTLTGKEYVYHFHCFVCSSCKKPFDKYFYNLDGKPYCSEHYSEAKGWVCHKCKGIIDSGPLSALDKMWHPACFVCNACNKPFTGPVFNHNGLPYCEADLKKIKGTKPTCKGCGRQIYGSVTNALGTTWHEGCFSCGGCGNPLEAATAKEKNGKPYCEKC
eukprot:TRINITY_DN374_c0_g1_i2.p1 TRINITY_DN374_c0_g1~~TRINITY_DN374_c0_g1_i2.p1  ORF type:complete len:575 (-),score=231.32 TRINITY_DN374_c0_g1_i2:57-1781(-)